ncbi:peptide-methionine (S)-S-oxide reductase [Thermoplasmatales archaeon SW_10_69_26]|nr:MAG: peptide-methionine (S)-S-oxide reductase [Thermoplasmatales archaeon SW_10_69_26]
MAKATLGGGCFWCIEAALQRIEGVEEVVPGYAGGESEDPTYREVCAGETSHAEVVQVTFDGDELGFRELLHVFFSIHNPTTKDREGNDVGSQYRSIVLTHDDDQRSIVEDVIDELEEAIYDDPIVTEVEPIETFHVAEDEHQDYYEKNPSQGYCRVVIDPKIEKLRAQWKDKIVEGA